MPVEEFKAMLQQMATEQLQQREDLLRQFQEAWWAFPAWMMGGRRPERPAFLWDERAHVYEEILERRRCKSCSFHVCQCPQPPQQQTQRESKRAAWLASLPPGERAHHEAMAPRQIYDTSGKVLLIEELDPEGEFPFYYFPGDSGRALAKHLGTRDSFYSWLDGPTVAL